MESTLGRNIRQVEFLETEDKTKPSKQDSSESVEIRGGNSEENPQVERALRGTQDELFFIRQHGEQGLPSKHGNYGEKFKGSVSEVEERHNNGAKTTQTTTANQNLIYTSSS